MKFIAPKIRGGGIVDDEGFYCPLCDGVVEKSEYLSTVFKDNPKMEWLANMVTHYRHEHVKYYNNSVGYVSFFHDYDGFKNVVNNRTKRQIIRKCKAFLLANNFTSKQFIELQNTEEKTIALANKILGKDDSSIQVQVVSE